MRVIEVVKRLNRWSQWNLSHPDRNELPSYSFHDLAREYRHPQNNHWETQAIPKDKIPDWEALETQNAVNALPGDLWRHLNGSTWNIVSLHYIHWRRELKKYPAEHIYKLMGIGKRTYYRKLDKSYLLLQNIFDSGVTFP